MRHLCAFLCLLFRHKWESDWREIDTDSVFFRRIDCLRCGLAIDGAALKRIVEDNPRLASFL